MSEAKLDAGQKNLLRLVAKDADANGWAAASRVVYQMFDKNMPRELVELEPIGDAGCIRLTSTGRAVVNAMDWM